MTPVCFTTVPFSSRRDLDRFHTVADLDRIDDLHAAHDTAKRGVLPIEVGGGAEHDVELATRRVGIALARHPENAALELPVVELRVERYAGPAGAHVRMVHRERLRLRIAELDDEARLDAVEALPVVESRPRELEEVLDVLGRVGGEELERDLPALLERHHRRR